VQKHPMNNINVKAIIDYDINEVLVFRNANLNNSRIKFVILKNEVIRKINNRGHNILNLDTEVHNALIWGIHTNKWLHEDHMGIMRICDIQQGGMIFNPLPIPSPPNGRYTPYYLTWNADKNQWDMSPAAPTATLQPKKVDPTVAVNDYTCLRCSNTKVSKTEKSCWKCGEPVLKVEIILTGKLTGDIF